MIEWAVNALKLTAMTYFVPFVLSFFVLSRQNGYLLLLMIAAMAMICFLVFMLPCIRFAMMIRSQEKKGYPFEAGEGCLLSKDMTGTYLGTEWLIRAGSVALHCTQCKAIRGVSNKYGRRRYSIVVETVDGQRYKWPLSQQNVKRVRVWLEQKNDENCRP